MRATLLYLLCVCLFLLPNHGKSNDGTYSDGVRKIYIENDSLVIMEPHNAIDYMDLSAAAKCEMIEMERNFFIIRSYESPVSEALRDIYASSEYCDYIPKGTFLIDVLLPNYTTNSDLNIELYVSTKDSWIKTITNGKVTFELNQTSKMHDKSSPIDIYFKIFPAEYEISMMPYLYFGNLYVPFSISSDILGTKDNKLTVRLPNMSSDIFMKYDITGDIIYCDGQCVKWRGRTYEKQND